MESNRDHHERHGSWVWGLVLIVLGALFLADEFIMPLSNAIWPVVMAGASVTFLGVYAANRRQWWALIPAYVFAAIAGLLVLVEIPLYSDLIPLYIFGAIAVPFLIVFVLRPSENWWALIPAYVMLALSGLLLLEMLPILPGFDLTGAYVMFAIALPFVVVFLMRPRENWWALIPAGIMSTIGVGLIGLRFDFVVPAALIAAGLILLVRTLGRPARHVERPDERPLNGPAADHAPANDDAPLTGPAADKATE